MEDFKTVEDFITWMNAPETDEVDGKSEELKKKQEIQRNMHVTLLKLVKGKTLDARNAAIEKIPYEERLKMVYEAQNAR